MSCKSNIVYHWASIGQIGAINSEAQDSEFIKTTLIEGLSQ